MTRYIRSLQVSSGLPRVDSEALIVISARNGGGGDAYLNNLVAKWICDRAVIILYPIPGGYEIELHHPIGGVCRAKVAGFDLSPLEERVSRCSEIFVNTLVGWPHATACAFAVGLKCRYGARLTIAFHDFHFGCPTCNLLYHGKSFCGDCGDCASCQPQIDVGAFRAASSELISRADELRFFSNSSKKLMARKIHLDESKVVVVPHQPLVAFEPIKSFSPAPLVVAIAGNVTPARGAEFIGDFARFLGRQDPSARIVILGQTERPYRFRNVIVHGPYKHDELPQLVAKYRVNVGFLPSICPETFSYVVQEFMMMGLPVACFSLGAQAERVSDYAKGAVIQSITPQDAYMRIRGLV